MLTRRWLVMPAFIAVMMMSGARAEDAADEPPPPPKVPESSSLLPPSLDDIVAEEGGEAKAAETGSESPKPSGGSVQKAAAEVKDGAGAKPGGDVSGKVPPVVSKDSGKAAVPAGGILSKPAVRKLAELEGAGDIVAVLPFRNAAGNSNGAKVAGSAASTLVTLLSEKSDVKVVERDMLDKIMEELQLSSSGLVQGKSAVKMGRLLGARYLITGDVREASYTRQTIKAYNINSVKDIYRVVLLVRMVDAATGRILLAKKAEKQFEEVITRYSNPVPGDRFTDVAEDALKEIVPAVSAALAKAGAGKAAKGAVPVKITSQPDGADVEIDGVFEGNCPLETELSPGVHEIKVSLPGYEVWAKKVRVRKGSKPIKVRLRPKTTTTEVNVKLEGELKK